jgi:hypothetical protein
VCPKCGSGAAVHTVAEWASMAQGPMGRMFPGFGQAQQGYPGGQPPQPGYPAGQSPQTGFPDPSQNQQSGSERSQYVEPGSSYPSPPQPPGSQYQQSGFPDPSQYQQSGFPDPSQYQQSGFPDPSQYQQSGFPDPSQSQQSGFPDPSQHQQPGSAERPQYTQPGSSDPSRYPQSGSADQSQPPPLPPPSGPQAGYYGVPQSGYQGQPWQGQSPPRNRRLIGSEEIVSDTVEGAIAEAVLGEATKAIGRVIGRRMRRAFEEKVVPAMAARQESVTRDRMAIAERHPELRACLNDQVIFLAGGTRTMPLSQAMAIRTVEQSDALVAQLRG